MKLKEFTYEELLEMSKVHDSTFAEINQEFAERITAEIEPLLNAGQFIAAIHLVEAFYSDTNLPSKELVITRINQIKESLNNKSHGNRKSSLPN